MSTDIGVLSALVGCAGFVGAMTLRNILELTRPTPAGMARRWSGWIPVWKLFAPAEFVTDYCLFARTRSTDDWVCILQPEPRRWYHVFWNPNTELYKYVANCAAAVEHASQDSFTSARGRQLLHRFACEELGTDDAELLCAKNVGTVTDGVYESLFTAVFTLGMDASRE